MNLKDFLREENEGVIFCKIGKSSIKMWGKGGHFPYRDYIGKTIKLSEGDITFERLDDVVKYLHYGDDLVIFSFTEGERELPMEGYYDDGGNKGSYRTATIYVKDVLSFRNPDTVDYIYNNVKDKTNFYELNSLASSHLRERDLLDAAQRWDELTVASKQSEINEKEKKTSFAERFFDWISKGRNSKE